MRFLFSTGSLYTYSIERNFAFARAAGFDGLELMVDQRWETRQVDYVQALIAQHAMPVVAVHTPFAPQIAGWPADQPGRIKRSLKLATALNAAVVVHHLPSRLGYYRLVSTKRTVIVPRLRNPEVDYVRWLESEYPVLQANTDIKLCVENIPAFRLFGRKLNYAHWNSPDAMLRFHNITLDTTHLATWGLDPVTVYKLWGERVKHIHLSNYQTGKEHLRPEMGTLQLDKLLGALAENGFDGTIALEIYPQNLLEGQPDERIIDAMHNSLAYCRKWAQ